MQLIRSAAVLGGGFAAYSAAERYAYRVRRVTVQVEPHVPALTILHLSDTHHTGRNQRLSTFLHRLPDLVGDTPDLVLATGDLVETDEGIPAVVEGLSRVEAKLGRYYVLGSHDYYESRLIRLVTRWFTPHGASKKYRIDTDRLEEGLIDKGWVALTNRTEVLEMHTGRIRLAGVDDPFLCLHKTDHICRSKDEMLAIGLMHAPDITSEWALHGFDLALAGHTHGGQVRIPGAGALVTNCSLPTALASGLHRIGSCWLHVSPGLGTGRYTPIRFACRPEATVLTLAPAAGAETTPAL